MAFREPRAEHIAVVLHDFAGGGSERVAIRLANRWLQAGRRVTILCGDPTGPARSHLDDRIEIRAVSPPIRRGWGSRFRLGAALRPLLRAAAPDVILAPGNFHASVTWRLVLGATAPPVVLKISNPLHRSHRGLLRQAIFQAWFRLITRRFAALVAMGPNLLPDIRRVTGRNDICCIEEPNLDDATAPRGRRVVAGPIVFAGRLTPQKNVGLALRTLAALGGAWTLQVLGDGPERAELEAAALRLDVAERVSFLGHVPDIAPYLRRASGLLCTSRYEGAPAVLIEALAAGLPIVTTDCTPALADVLIHPSFGQVAAAEPQALADALTVVLAGDGPAAEPLAALMQRHRTGSSSQRWLDLLDSVVAARLDNRIRVRT